MVYNPTKRTETTEKITEKIDFKLEMDLCIYTKDKNDAGMRQIKNTILLQNDGSFLSYLQSNALASLIHFVACKQT